MIGFVWGGGVRMKGCEIGPQLPCGSMVKVRRIVFAVRRLFMTMSPLEVFCGVSEFVLTFLLLHLYLPFSLSCRC